MTILEKPILTYTSLLIIFKMNKLVAKFFNFFIFL